MLDPSSTEFLADIGNTMATADRPDMALEQTLEAIRQGLRAEAASIFLFDEGEQILECKASLGPNPATGMTVPRGTGIVGQVADQGRAMLVADAAHHPAFYRGIDEKTGFVTRSMVCAPLAIRGKVLGTVMLLNKAGNQQFTDHDRALLVSYCALAALSINNARLSILVLEQERLRRELEIAREIQRSMLPGRGPGTIQGANLPARVVSGDFYGQALNADGEAWFCLGDVSGKGIDAALWMVRALSIFSSLAQMHRSPARLLEALNRELRQVALRGMFITMVAGRIDEGGCHARLANAGHLPVLIWEPGKDRGDPRVRAADRHPRRGGVRGRERRSRPRHPVRGERWGGRGDRRQDLRRPRGREATGVEHAGGGAVQPRGVARGTLAQRRAAG